VGLFIPSLSSSFADLSTWQPLHESRRFIVKQTPPLTCVTGVFAVVYVLFLRLWPQHGEARPGQWARSHRLFHALLLGALPGVHAGGWQPERVRPERLNVSVKTLGVNSRYLDTLCFWSIWCLEAYLRTAAAPDRETVSIADLDSRQSVCNFPVRISSLCQKILPIVERIGSSVLQCLQSGFLRAFHQASKAATLPRTSSF
jgi:hypothetical protein